MTISDLLTDWLSFLKYITSQIDNGRSEFDISNEFGGKIVEWDGCIADIKLNEKYSPGIALIMKPEILPLSKGKILRADHLFLNVDERTRSSWNGCKVGDKVKFKAVIAKTFGPFPEIQLSEDKGDPEILLMVGLYDCELISVV